MHLSEADRLQFRLEPTPEVIQSVHNRIQRHEEAIGTLEDRIQRLLEQVRELQYDQAKHRADIARCCGLITLARRLPEELLIKIFVHCVEGGWTRAPVVVSHVCSAWRKAAHAPQVWSHIYVRCDDANVYDRTRFWLNMARAADLHVTVAASHHVPEWQMQGLLDLLTARSEQWFSLKIETDTLRHADFILSQCHRSMPTLRRVEVWTNAMDSADAGGELNLTLLTTDRAPRLSSMRYSSSVVPAVPIFPSHINDLTIEVRESPAHRPLSAASIIGTLEPLLELRNLTVTMPLVYEQPFVPEEDQARIVSLPDLTTLTLYGPTDLNELLPHLHTPALRRLHLRSLEDVGYRQQPIGPSLTRYLEQSAPPLELLELHDIDLAPETFATCFGALPALRELRLHESSISDATLGLLRGPRGLCPRLARVALRWCGLLHGRALVDLVRSRHVVAGDARAGAPGPLSDPIEEVGVINCCFVEERDVLELARMAVCRIVMRDGEDYCRPRDCCSNGRYRTRFRLRHMPELIESGGSIRLIL